MMWTMTCRVIASIVTFLIGWTLFAIARPSEEIRRLPEPTRQISAITLMRMGCTDAERKCPIFQATYRSDGTCSYFGYANDDYMGEYKGTYNPQDFTYMVEQINKQGFYEMPLAFPDSSVTETTTVEILGSDGTRHVTTYNWANTPSGLRALQSLIEQQAYETDWEKVE